MDKNLKIINKTTIALALAAILIPGGGILTGSILLIKALKKLKAK